MSKKLSSLLLIAAFVIVLIITLMPGDGKCAGNYLDKVVHFIVFLFLSVSICFRFSGRKKVINFLFFAILLGFVTEIAQQYIPGRNMDIYDALADVLGVIVGSYLFKGIE